VNFDEGDAGERCEFVLAATESKAFVRVARLKLFLERHPESELASLATSEIAAAMWLLGDAGGAILGLACGTDRINTFEAESVLAASLMAVGHGRQAQAWFERAKADCSERFLADLTQLYVLNSECSRRVLAECGRGAAKLLACRNVDERVARKIVAAAQKTRSDGVSDLRTYLLLNGYDESAMFWLERVGLLGYIAGSSVVGDRCLLIKTDDDDFLPIRDAFWLWLKERGFEARHVGGGMTVIGPRSYEQMERLKSEVARLFGLESRLGSCPKEDE